MKAVTLDVRSPSAAMANFAQTWKTGKSQRGARISFAAPKLLWKVLTEKRWELLKVLCGTGPVSIRETARRVGRIVFPFEAVKVKFLPAGGMSLAGRASPRLSCSHRSVSV